jgi:hypothetical protein
MVKIISSNVDEWYTILSPNFQLLLLDPISIPFIGILQSSFPSITSIEQYNKASS